MIICPIHESNDCHNPSGAGGGQFCSHSGLDLKYADQVAKVRGKQYAVHVNRDAVKYGDPGYSSTAAANPDASYKSYRHVVAAIQRAEERRSPRKTAPAGKGRKTGFGQPSKPNLGTQKGWEGYLRKSGLVPVKDKVGTTWWTKPGAAKTFDPNLTGHPSKRGKGLLKWEGKK